MKLKIEAWRIEAYDSSLETKEFRESIFSQANGYMGMRGYAPEDPKVDTFSRTTFISGFYEYIRPGITDLVNQPDISSTSLWLNGYDVASLQKKEFRQTLNMRDGTLCWNYTVEDKEGRQTHVTITRFLSMARRHVAVFRFEITPINHDGTYDINTGVDAEVENLPISDNQLTENKETVQIWSKPEIHESGLYMETSYSKRGTAAEYRVVGSSSGGSNKGKTNVIDKIAVLYSYRDGNGLKALADHEANNAADVGFDALLTENRNTWDLIWKTADIELDAKEELQGALRYNIFQLIQTAPHKDPRASIGARGLSHGRYKGCVFWDTEIFMLPFYLHTDPETAKNLLLFRYNTLQDAIESAKRFSLSGARFPWMSSDTGFEQCETWDTGCCEIHITADIAYAFGRYIEVTGDEDFFLRYASEVFIETARYWTSRFTYNAESDKYNLLFVKGPDEYCGVTNNNLFTVRMAAHNLQLAINAVERMEKEYPVEWLALKEKVKYDTAEKHLWNEIIQKVVIRYDENKQLFLQDDTFELLEPINPADYKNDDRPMYHKISYDRLQRYKVLKQADVLMLMALLPDEFSTEQKRAAWNYYEPLTLHDSTLSFGVHALIAAQLALFNKSEEYFNKSCYLDLKNVMMNTAKEGLHTATQGITWQTMVFGFAGLWIDKNGIKCDPILPEWLHGMRFTVFYKGSPYRITIEEGKEAMIEAYF